MRYIIVKVPENTIINYVDYASPPPTQVPGYGPGYIAIQHDTVDKSWTYNGSTFVAPTPVPPPPPPTQDELYDILMLQSRLLKAVVLVLNDGTLPIGTNKTPGQLKNIIKVKI